MLGTMHMVFRLVSIRRRRYAALCILVWEEEGFLVFSFFYVVAVTCFVFLLCDGGGWREREGRFRWMSRVFVCFDCAGFFRSFF